MATGDSGRDPGGIGLDWESVRGGAMKSSVPVVIVASASHYERLRTEYELEKTGRSVCCVTDTMAAESLVSENGGTSILVIDSGLLEAAHDAQWRELRGRHPELAAVVRCLVPRHEIQRADRNTLLVHPSNIPGICAALDLLDRYRLRELPKILEACWSARLASSYSSST
jgi:hypothetical protein